MRLIYRPADNAGPDLIGARAFSTSVLGRRFPVPSWFVVSREAFQSCLGEEQRAKLQAARSIADIQVAIAEVRPHPVLRNEVSKELAKQTESPRFLALRPSFSEGELEANVGKDAIVSDLFVAPDKLVERLLAMWKVFYGEANLRYRMERRMPALALPPPVLVQNMPACECAGDVFDVDPGSADRRIALVRAVPGCGTALALGDCEPDSFFVAKDGSIEKAVIGQKVAAHTFDEQKGHGIKVVALPAHERNRSCLNDERAAAIATLGRKVADALGRPIVTQWAIADGKLYVLGARPASGLGKHSDPEGRVCTWDLEGLGRDMDGTCSPLTFSFHRGIEEASFSAAASFLGSKDSSSAQPVGYLARRIFRNRSAWRTMLARSALPEQITSLLHDGLFLGKPAASSRALKERGLDLIWELGASVKLLAEGASSAQRLFTALARFESELTEITETGAPGDLSLESLLERIEALAGALRKVAAEASRNDLTIAILLAHLERLSPDCGALDEPDLNLEDEAMRDVETLLALARHSLGQGLGPLLSSSALEDVESELSAHRDTRAVFAEASVKLRASGYGSLQLETVTLSEDPLPLYRAIGCICERAASGSLDLSPVADSPRDPPKSPAGWRGKIFSLEWKAAARRVPLAARWRSLRRTATGIAGQTAREMGKRLVAFEVLERPEDIFLLTLAEIGDFLRGQSVDSDLRPLVASRRASMDDEISKDEPAAGQKTAGSPYQGSALAREHAGREPPHFEPLSGGSARAPIRFLRGAADLPVDGSVVAVQSIRPTWPLSLAASSGIVIRSGSLFAKRVCRRLGIPAVKAIADPRAVFKKGDLVEIDGKLGTLQPVEPAPRSADPSEEAYA